MNKTIAALTLALLAAAGGPARATDVGVSIEISQPGVYGRVDIGRFPQPAVIVPQPVIIGRPVMVAPQPVYLWVPPGHRKNWRKHCRDYNACGVPVYFVDHRWYRSHVMPARYDGRGPDRRADDRRYDDRRYDDRRYDDRRYDDRRGDDRRYDGRPGPDRRFDDGPGRGRGGPERGDRGPQGHGPRG